MDPFMLENFSPFMVETHMHCIGHNLHNDGDLMLSLPSLYASKT